MRRSCSVNPRGSTQEMRTLILCGAQGKNEVKRQMILIGEVIAASSSDNAVDDVVDRWK